jgi:uncharacterized protein (DUF1501 family)
MALTRRQFIKRTGLVTAGGLLAPGLFRNPFVRTAMAETIGDRYFLVIYLDGGNDGLNTVTPLTNGGGTLRDDYEVARQTGNGGLQLTPTDLQLSAIGQDPNTTADLALHPGFRGFSGLPGFGGIHDLYGAGKVAVVQGCGYPEYNLSHDVASTIWQTGDPLGLGGYGSTGWVGRYLAQPSTGYSGLDIPGVNISSAVAGEYLQTKTSVLSLNRVRDFGFPFDPDYDDDDDAKAQAFLDLHAESIASAQPTVQLIGGAGTATYNASQSYPGLHSFYRSNRPVFDQMYSDLNTSTARDLREVAKIIYGVESMVPNVEARHFWVRNGGYDTHADQGAATGQHFNLHAEVASAVKVFYDDLADMGAADKLCIIVWSEFSRRIPQNSSGTDHGSQAPMFVIGGKVNGGVYGNHPNINDGALDNEENTPYSQSGSFRSTDIRDVYGTVLKHWFNMPHGIILPNVLRLDSGFPAATYWTVENFDLVHPVNAQPMFLP